MSFLTSPSAATVASPEAPAESRFGFKILHAVWTFVFRTFREKRFRQFLERIRPTPQDRMVDVGGYPQTWLPHEVCAQEIHLVNVDAISRVTDTRGHHFLYHSADGCALPFADGAMDICFSNSVIEHVGNWERQQQCAAEMRRVARRLWVQTPARECWMEPHYLMPFIHWLPVAARLKLARNFTVWGWITRPNRKQVEFFVNDIRLLTHAEMKELFPDCEILREKLLGIFTKSYIAVRTQPSTSANVGS